MNDAQNSDAVEESFEVEDEEPVKHPNGDEFFNPPEKSWFLFTIILAGILFLFWGIQSEMELTMLAIIVPVYVISIIIPFRTPYRENKITETEGVPVFIFHRGGFSYQLLLDAILGAVIPIVLVSFFLTQGIPSSPELNRNLMLIAMLCLVIIVPVVPLLGSIKRLGILKTTLIAELDESKSKVISLNLDVNPLDGYWHRNREEPELIESIIETINELLKEYP
ncbi:MAG: hypothetical protein ACTSUB_02860 [Candidatus Thorarchaeota archaeon]